MLRLILLLALGQVQPDPMVSAGIMRGNEGLVVMCQPGMFGPSQGGVKLVAYVNLANGNALVGQIKSVRVDGGMPGTHTYIEGAGKWRGQLATYALHIWDNATTTVELPRPSYSLTVTQNGKVALHLSARKGDAGSFVMAAPGQPAVFGGFGFGGNFGGPGLAAPTAAEQITALKANMANEAKQIEALKAQAAAVVKQ